MSKCGRGTLFWAARAAASFLFRGSVAFLITNIGHPFSKSVSVSVSVCITMSIKTVADICAHRLSRSVVVVVLEVEVTPEVDGVVVVESWYPPRERAPGTSET